eukprot:769424-Amphidinium_carterae.1
MILLLRVEFVGRYHEPRAMCHLCSVAMRLMHCGIDLHIILRCACLKPQHRRGLHGAVRSQSAPCHFYHATQAVLKLGNLGVEGGGSCQAYANLKRKGRGPSLHQGTMSCESSRRQPRSAAYTKAQRYAKTLTSSLDQSEACNLEVQRPNVTRELSPSTQSLVPDTFQTWNNLGLACGGRPRALVGCHLGSEQASFSFRLAATVGADCLGCLECGINVAM